MKFETHALTVKFILLYLNSLVFYFDKILEFFSLRRIRFKSQKWSRSESAHLVNTLDSFVEFYELLWSSYRQVWLSSLLVLTLFHLIVNKIICFCFSWSVTWTATNLGLSPTRLSGFARSLTDAAKHSSLGDILKKPFWTFKLWQTSRTELKSVVQSDFEKVLVGTLGWITINTAIYQRLPIVLLSRSI